MEGDDGGKHYCRNTQEWSAGSDMREEGQEDVQASLIGLGRRRNRALYISVEKDSWAILQVRCFVGQPLTGGGDRHTSGR